AAPATAASSRLPRRTRSPAPRRASGDRCASSSPPRCCARSRDCCSCLKGGGSTSDRAPAAAPRDYMSLVKGLACRECGSVYDKAAVHVCESCFGPLEVKYDFSGVSLTREDIARRPTSMWRYWELLPLDGPATVGTQVGWT